MNKYIKLAIGIVFFILLFVGAGALYNKLSKNYDRGDSLVTQSNEQNAENTTEANREGVAENTTESTTEFETGNTTENTDEASLAMNFTVVNANDDEVTLHSFFGKPIVLNFWASWCGPCKSEFPEFQAAFEEYGDDIEFLMVNMTDGTRETIRSADEFISSEGYTLPVYYDVKQDAAYTYYVYSLPTTYFIDASGNIVAYAQGAIDLETLKKGIEMITE